MAGVQPQADRQCRFGSCHVARQHSSVRRRAMGRRVGFGIQLDAVGTNGGHRGHQRWLRIHEQADAHAKRARFGDHRRHAFEISQCKAVVAGELSRRVGHEGALLRPVLAHEAHQVVQRIAFDVELGVRPALQQRRQIADIVRADVPLVGPRVHGDALRSGLEAQRRRASHARDAKVAGVAQQRDLVDVDRQRTARLPGASLGSDQWVHGGVLGSNGFKSRSTWRVRNGTAPR